MSNMGLKTAIFNKDVIKYKMATFDSLQFMNMATFFDQTKCYSTQKKGSFRWPTSNSMKKNIEKVQN